MPKACPYVMMLPPPSSDFSDLSDNQLVDLLTHSLVVSLTSKNAPVAGVCGSACRGGDILIQKINPLMRHSLECELHACLHLVEVAVARERVFVQVAVGVVKHHLRIFVESVVHAQCGRNDAATAHRC